jgi:hypothetical protein
LDKVVPFEQYFTSVSPPGRSLLQLLEHGAAPGVFTWEMAGHGRGDPLGAWRPSFSPLADGLVRTGVPTFVFSLPSGGHLGVPAKLGVWKGQQRPEHDPRGVINGFCRWDSSDLIDRPDRLEVSLWLAGDRAAWRRCPVASMSYSVSPRGTRQFPILPGCAFRYRVEPDGLSGRAKADRYGVLTIDKVPLHRGRDQAVRLRIEHAMSVPIVSLTSPTHPTLVPRETTAVIARWTVANSSQQDPMPVDRYRCWIATDPNTPCPSDAETPQTRRVFESLAPGCYHVMAQARLVTGRWGPVTVRRVNIDPASAVK